jgi:hypothetical protein
VLDTPYFQRMSTKGPTREIQKATLFTVRLKHLGGRAGYLKSPMVYDFRAEGLYLISKFPL